jgi:hypothetical protein
MKMTAATEQRDGLHDRVRAFIDESARGAQPSEGFDALALAILGYQADRVPAYARLLAAAGVDPRRVESPRALPAMPTEAFRLARIAAHEPACDQVVFRTSGTTGPSRGVHALSTTETYERASLAWGRWALFFDDPKPLTAIVLAPRADPAVSGESSLNFMMQLFASSFATGAHYLQAGARSLIDGEKWQRICASISKAGTPVVIMGTSFAFVHALDALRGARFAFPPGSRAMHTGGFKGRSREVEPDVLQGQMAEAFGLDAKAIVGEYGMTELTSQLYEGTLRAHRGWAAASDQHGVFVPPPWMRVVAVDPDTLRPLAEGEVGILRFEDLANVDSALAVQTADRGRCSGNGVELLGRAAGSPPRGCSLAIEELLSD